MSLCLSHYYSLNNNYINIIAIIVLIDYLYGKVGVMHFYHIKYHDDHCCSVTNVFFTFFIGQYLLASYYDTVLLERNKNVSHVH